MHQYEIRIERKHGTPQVARSSFLGDFHAIRRAEQLAAPNGTMEVWREDQCIFRRETLTAACMAA